MPLEDQYARLGVQYYVAARHAALAVHMPVCGNLMHHAVEVLLKCGVLKGKGVPAGEDVDKYFRNTFSHHLGKLWPSFKALHPNEDLSIFDKIVTELDAWEEIRYPSETRGFGAAVSMGKTPDGSDHYVLGVKDCDELMKRLWGLVSWSPDWFRMMLNHHGEAAYLEQNEFKIY